MVSISPIFIFISFLGVSYGQLLLGETFVSILDISSTILQQTVQITGNYSNTAALLNATISFSDGECMNPMVLIEREAIDYSDSTEFLNIYFGGYDNESFLTQCGSVDSSETEDCGGFVECIVFSPPNGTYDLLEFFVFQPDTVSAECGDEAFEEGPLRSVRVKFTVTCQSEVECGEDEPTEEQDSEESGSGSSSEDGARTMRKVEHYEDMHVSPIYSKDNESKKEEVENIPVRIDCDSYLNMVLMIVLCICVCWIAQCALFYRYK